MRVYIEAATTSVGHDCFEPMSVSSAMAEHLDLMRIGDEIEVAYVMNKWGETIGAQPIRQAASAVGKRLEKQFSVRIRDGETRIRRLK